VSSSVRELDTAEQRLGHCKRKMLKGLSLWKCGCGGRMEKISWTEKKTDEEVLELVGEEHKMVSLIIMRKKNWIGHILWHECYISSGMLLRVKYRESDREEGQGFVCWMNWWRVLMDWSKWELKIEGDENVGFLRPVIWQSTKEEEN